MLAYPQTCDLPVSASLLNSCVLPHSDISNILPWSMTDDDFGSVGAFDSTEDFILRLTGFSFSMFSFAELFLVPWPNVG